MSRPWLGKTIIINPAVCIGHIRVIWASARHIIAVIDGNHLSKLDGAAKSNCSSHQQVEEEEVEKLHARYYAAVEQLYHKHSKTFPGCRGVRLVMH